MVRVIMLMAIVRSWRLLFAREPPANHIGRKCICFNWVLGFLFYSGCQYVSARDKSFGSPS